MRENELQEKALALRHLVLDTYEAGKMGHISSSFSCVELMTALFYGGVMRFRTSAPDWDERDRFLLSKGHAGLLYYCILADLGYFLPFRIKAIWKSGQYTGRSC